MAGLARRRTGVAAEEESPPRRAVEFGGLGGQPGTPGRCWTVTPLARPAVVVVRHVPQRTEIRQDEQEFLRSVRASRIALPILIGVGVVGYLFYRQFDPAEWEAIVWTRATLGWIAVSLGLLAVRHLAYALRLYLLSERDFAYAKCLRLIFIWEFSSAVSPTSVGGSAVALFVLSQERLSAARTATLVLYTVVLDAAFFVLTLPVLFAVLGPVMIYPGAETFADLRGWGVTFLVAYGAMAVYGTFLAWGLFLRPNRIRLLLYAVSRWRWVRRFRKTLRALGDDMVVASRHMRGKPLAWHVGAFGSTAVAWSFRFLLLSALFLAFTGVSPDALTQTALYARLESMFVIIAFSPTPGGAGFVETLFERFLTDFVDGNSTSALVIATVWRAFTYYAYLLAGVIVIPAWLRGVMARRAEKRRLDRAERASLAATGELLGVGGEPG